MNYMYYFLNVSENTYKLQIPYASKVFKKKYTNQQGDSQIQ